MLPLRDFQAEMTAYLLSPPGPSVPDSLLALLPSDGPHNPKRFAVYKNNVYARLVDALRDTFPAVERLVGEEFFRYAAVQYVAQTPPRIGTLLAYGGSFPQFLSTFPPAGTVPYLSDVARLEYLYLESYHAPDAAPIVSLPSDREQLRPMLHPSARLMTSPFQVSRIWELNRSEATFDNVTLPQQREYLLIVRPEREVEVRRLSLGAYAAVLAFADGGSLAAAYEEATWANPSFDFAAHVETLAKAGTFVAFTEHDVQQ
ncbi:MAG: putative DNA-binding domain-containing protein [Proteobacteria bacterium]|nr:putative DNA-binding domain-containing protein [Pseudomonadota bacterium]